MARGRAAQRGRGTRCPTRSFELTGIRVIEWSLAALSFAKAAVMSSIKALASCWGPQLNASRCADGRASSKTDFGWRVIRFLRLAVLAAVMIGREATG